jgi:hypothetical protein
MYPMMTSMRSPVLSIQLIQDKWRKPRCLAGFVPAFLRTFRLQTKFINRPRGPIAETGGRSSANSRERA